MIALESKIRTRRCLLNGLIALTVGATSAGAEVLVPFTPGNQLVPTVQVTVTPESGGTYKYDYQITLDGSDPTKQQKAWHFELALNGDVFDTTSPPGWSFGQNVSGVLYNWACTEVEPLALGEIDDGDVPPCAYSIAPGSTLAGFGFRSNYPAGDVKFWIQGETPLPVATECDEPVDGAGVRFHDDTVSGVLQDGGPVSQQTCPGAADGAPCDDGLFCNGVDTCLNGRCSQHAGTPCTGAGDGDGNCAEDCDEDSNNCSRNDFPGSPCPEDGNPCTVDECYRGICDHPPGNADAVCGASQGDCHPAPTCTGTSIVCPSSAIAPAGTACADDNNPCTLDTCDEAGSCVHTVGDAGAVCRVSQGECDLVESCTGTSSVCPPDLFKPPTTICREAADICDLAEECTGSSATCAADEFQAATTECRASAGDCDVAEYCTGAAAACRADAFKPSTTECRASAGDWDVAESCTGSAAACPADALKSSTTECRASAGICDVAESCTGSTDSRSLREAVWSSSL